MGRPTADWLPLIAQPYAQEEQAAKSPADYARPPSGAASAAPDDTYLGSGGKATKVRVESLDKNGLGTFTRDQVTGAPWPRCTRLVAGVTA
ncbi:hypothetical protein [Streptomyces sp. NPDC005283]|uniref:hypothetical protein n=1 Tax=Streptomyces sp. NPDC005283 TaxID=3156871 RepID=UPI0034555513